MTLLANQFPILSRNINGHRLVYLDNSATTQKPQIVLDSILDYYQNHNANIHRGVHALSEESTNLWEKSRQIIADFFGAQNEELIITRNTTEALNLLALSWQQQNSIQSGDVIIVSLSEHHSNFVPWQKLAQQQGAKLVVLPLTPDGLLDQEAAKSLFKKFAAQLKIVALQHVSNTLGTVMPIDLILDLLVELNIRSQVRVVVDAAQSAAHLPINFNQWGVEALAFSGHKMYGPMGSGGLLVRQEILAEMEPILLGGGMIATVTESQTAYSSDLIDRFTAGTPDVASVVGLAAACQFMSAIGWEKIMAHEQELLEYGLEKLGQNSAISLVGPTKVTNQANQPQRIGALTFVYQGVHAHDMAQILDRFGVAVRSGQHCTMPLHLANNWAATTRASLAVYNTKEDIDVLVEALQEVEKIFGK